MRKKQRAGKRHDRNLAGQSDGLVHANPEIYLWQSLAQFPDRELSSDVRFSEVGVVERAAAPGQFEPRGSAELADPHGDDFFRRPLPLKKIEELFQLRGRVGSRRDLDDVRA